MYVESPTNRNQLKFKDYPETYCTKWLTGKVNHNGINLQCKKLNGSKCASYEPRFALNWSYMLSRHYSHLFDKCQMSSGHEDLCSYQINSVQIGPYGPELIWHLTNKY